MDYKWLFDIAVKYNCPLDCLRYCITSKPNVGINSYFQGRYLVEKIKDQPNLIDNYRKRVRNSYKKIKHFNDYKKLFSTISWIEMVGISGTVAALNAKKEDDIDLFIITKPRRIWLTRLSDWYILKFFQTRMYHEISDQRDKFCPNFYRSSDFLEISPKTPKNAVELANLIPVYDRQDGQTYYRLLKANKWIKEFLPEWYNWQIKQMETCFGFYKKEKAELKANVLKRRIGDVSEVLAGFGQRLYMLRHRKWLKTDKGFIKELRFWVE